MKNWKRLSLLLCLLLGLSGCGQVPDSSSASEEPDPIRLETLTVELPRELDTAGAEAAMERLPQLLSQQGVEVGQVDVTFGTSYGATAAALEEGGVQLAFLPAETFVELCETAVPVLADAAPTLTLTEQSPLTEWNAQPAQRAAGYTAGTYAMVCAGPSQYGQKLAGLAQDRSLTWEELAHARWGVLDGDSLAGYQCLELWLEDRYEGSGITDLPDVTAYSGWEELLRAAAEEQVDCIPLPADLREEKQELWTLEKSRTDAAGQSGFGRAAPIAQELPVLALTPRLYSFVAAVSGQEETLCQPAFQTALQAALEQAFSDPADRLAALGAAWYAPVEPEDLAGLRRLLL